MLKNSNSDNFRFWQFPFFSKSGKIWILTNSNADKFRFPELMASIPNFHW